MKFNHFISHFLFLIIKFISQMDTNYLEVIEKAFSRKNPLKTRNRLGRVIVSYTEEGASWSFRTESRCNRKICYTGVSGTNCVTCGGYYCENSEIMLERYPSKMRCSCEYFNIGFEKENEINLVYRKTYIRCVCSKNCFSHDVMSPLNEFESVSSDSDYFSD